MPLLLYLAFTLSGAAGLMYESIWSRYLGLFVGHGAYAQILVLVIFLGGMSGGAWLTGRRSTRFRDPLLWYAGIELAVAVTGFVFHDVFVTVTNAAYDGIFPHLPAGAAVTVVKWTLAALLILPQSLLLGATFPLLSAGAIRRMPQASGRVLALLYFTNSLGAAIGVLVAGFWLAEAVGLPGTLLAAALLNVGAALLTYVAARTTRVETADEMEADAIAVAPPVDPVTTGPPPEINIGGDAVPGAILPTPVGTPALHATATPAAARRAPSVPGAPPRLVRALLLVAFGTAMASFVYEIAWIRMLSLVVGSATHSFEIMLSAFILGLALGAYWVRTRADRFADPIRVLGITQWVMGSLAIATLPLYVDSFGWMAMLLDALATNESAYRVFSASRYLFCLAVMLPATFCAGITLPLITRTLLARGDGERAIGRVYAVNTLGSILGAALAGLVLMPLLGLKWLLVVGALLDVALGFYLLLGGAASAEPVVARLGGVAGVARRTAAGEERAATLVAVVATLVVLLTTAIAVDFSPALLTSGVYRYGRVFEPGRFVVPFYEDGRTATVSVRRDRRGRTYTLATNGKPDASLTAEWIQPSPTDTVRRRLGGDQVTQAMLPLVALAHAPGAKSAAVIGQGSGMTSHLLLGSPRLARLSTIEIEPAMIRGSRAFYPANRRVFDDPRNTFVIDDAKAYFASAHRTFDIIVSEPSNPWVSGVSGLFTDEFYGRVQSYLAPGGVFTQWLHLYEIDDRLVMSVLAALHRHFPAYEVFLVSNSDLVVVATNGPALRAPDWRVVDEPAIAADFARTLPLTPATFEGARVADRGTLAPLVERWRGVNSDYFPVLDLGAERTRFRREAAIGFKALGASRFDVVAALRGIRRDFGTAILSPAALPRVDMQARGVQVRTLAESSKVRLYAQPTLESLEAADVDGGELRAALYRYAALDVLIASGRPPADWHRFVAHALDVEDDLHGGTSGVADEAFYGRVLSYMDGQGAPAPARATVRFAHGMAAWQWREVLQAADVLIPELQRGEPWLTPELLHDGAVVAALRSGEPERARAYGRALAPRLTRPALDVRSILLDALLADVADRPRAAVR